MTFFPYELKLRHVFTVATYSRTTTPDVQVEIEYEGVTGYGEASMPPYLGETVESVMNFLKKVNLEQFSDPFQLEDILSYVDSLSPKDTAAKAAVDMAVYDLFARSCKKPLYKVLGGNKTEIETDLTISVNGIDEMVADSLKAVEQGFRILKIKVGKEGIKDIDRIKAIRQAVGPAIRLRIDANQGWSPKEAVRIIRAREDMGIEMDLVEQPVKAHDIEGMKFVTSQVYTPVLADESVFSTEDAIRLIQERGADLINIKLMKTGGIYEALKICGIAESYGVECMIGCMLESKIAVSAAAHLAAGKSIITRADLDGPSLCKEDPYTGGPIYERNRILMNESPGLGITQVPQYAW